MNSNKIEATFECEGEKVNRIQQKFNGKNGKIVGVQQGHEENAFIECKPTADSQHEGKIPDIFITFLPSCWPSASPPTDRLTDRQTDRPTA